MTDPTAVGGPARPAERRRKLLPVAGGLALVAAVALLAYAVLHKKPHPGAAPEPPPPAGPSLQAALDEADRLDPDWRFADLEAHRAPVPDKENAAPLVLAAAKRIPSPWVGPPPAALFERLRKGPFDAGLRADLRPLQPAAAEARKLAGYRRGRHAVAWNFKGPLATPLPHLRATDDVVQVLALDAEARSHEGDPGGALESIRAAVVANRTVGDEPMRDSQIMRTLWHYATAQALQDALGRGQAPAEELAATQALLDEEAAQPLLLTIARAERAGLHDLMGAIERGDLTREALPPHQPNEGGRTEGLRLILSIEALHQPAALEAIHAFLLDFTTQFVEIARRPPEEWAAPLKALEDGARDAPAGAGPLLPAPADTALACRNSQALLRSAIAGLALERYRLAKGHWPDKLADLAPDYLKALPADPFDGQPLRYARHPGAVSVYAVGPDGKDDGGKPDDLNRFFEKKDGYDVGFLLRDPESRKAKK